MYEEVTPLVFPHGWIMLVGKKGNYKVKIKPDGSGRRGGGDVVAL
jgi:hypothetical protein